MSEPPSDQGSTPTGPEAGPSGPEDGAPSGPEADAVRDYLKKISQVPGLSPGQEAELAQQIEAGLAAETKLTAG